MCTELMARLDQPGVQAIPKKALRLSTGCMKDRLQSSGCPTLPYPRSAGMRRPGAGHFYYPQEGRFWGFFFTVVTWMGIELWRKSKHGEGTTGSSRQVRSP